MRGELKGFEVPEFMRKKMLTTIATGKSHTIPNQLLPENKTNGVAVVNVGCPSGDAHSLSENVKVMFETYRCLFELFLSFAPFMATRVHIVSFIDGSELCEWCHPGDQRPHPR